jgi:hypothetical protein
MKLMLTASTGVKITVWRDEDLFKARRAGTVEPPEVCLGIDLFEVIADLSGLDLDRRQHANEALVLADEAQRQLVEHAAAGRAGELLGARRSRA